MIRGPIAVLITILALAAVPVAAQDADGDTIEDAQEAAIATAHAPVLFFHPGESYFPTSVAYALRNSVLERYQSNTTVLVDQTPTPSDLAAFSDPTDPDLYFLNNTGGTVHDEAGIRISYEAGGDPKTVYVHVATNGSFTIAQYWFYYAFNPGTWNNHEGDWEMVQVVLTGSSPVEVGYSQHESGEKMAWENVDRDGTHPKVYVARGSHSSYLRSYEGNIGIAGDDVSDAGPVWQPTDYTLVNVGELNAPSPGNEWLRFAGRWGEYSPAYDARAEAGPPGPAYRQGQRMFSEPVPWANGLDVPNTYVLLANWFLENLFLIFLLLVLLGIVLAIVRIVRVQRATHAGVKMWPYAHAGRRNRTTMAMLVAAVGMVVGLAGFLLPWYSMTVDANAPGFLVTDGPEELLRMDGVDGLTLNPMRPDGEIVHVSVLPIPLGLMLAVTTALFFLRITGTKTSRKLGVRFIRKGIVAILPFVFVLLVMSFLIPALPADDPSQLGVDDFLRPIATSPLGGRTTQTISGGTATLAWGLGLGAWFLLVSGVLMFVAGALAISHPYSFLPRAPSEPKEGEEEAAAPAISSAEPAMEPAVEPATTAVGEAPPMQNAEPPPGPIYPLYYDPSAPEPAEPSQPVSDPVQDEPVSDPVQDDSSTPMEFQTAAPVVEPVSGKCANCGTPFEAGISYCDMCGNPVP